MNYHIELITDIDKLHERAKGMAQFVNKKSNLLKRDSSFVDDYSLFGLRSWQVLQAIDGSTVDNEQAVEIQQEAQDYFSESELQELFTIALNSRINKKLIGGQPGFNHQNEILYERIIKRPVSQFHKVVTEHEDLVKDITNKAFWESLANSNTGWGYLTVGKFLKEDYTFLNPEFVKEGIEVFEWSAGLFHQEGWLQQDAIQKAKDCIRLAVEDERQKRPISILHKYLSFFNEIDMVKNDVGIKATEIVPFIDAYARAVVVKDAEWGYELYPNAKNYLQKPLVRKYQDLKAELQPYVDEIKELKEDNKVLREYAAEVSTSMSAQIHPGVQKILEKTGELEHLCVDVLSKTDSIEQKVASSRNNTGSQA